MENHRSDHLHDDRSVATALKKLPYEALLVLSFGGPEGPDDVLPFLENVTRGRNIPRERLMEVSEHYMHFGGKSPINDQNRALIAALQAELAARNLELPIYWGNRNWHPLLSDTMAQMKADGVGRAIAFFTSAFSSYSGCRQYREDLAASQAEVGESAPQFDKLRSFYNHPGFLEPTAEALQAAWSGRGKVLFTAHSIPTGMAANCRYEQQLREASRLVAERVGLLPEQWEVVYQSRSGPPTQPWLEPDVLDRIRQLDDKEVYLVPIGFVSDHMEVLFDLDTEAVQLCDELGIACKRIATVGTHPLFVSMIVDLIEERCGLREPVAVGTFPPNHNVCPADCCLPGRGEPRPAACQAP